MTYKNGFAGGLVVGFMTFLFLNGNIEITPASLSAIAFVDLIAVLATIASFFIGIGTVIVGHAIPNTTVDGFIYGFTVIFDAPYILYLIDQAFAR